MTTFRFLALMIVVSFFFLSCSDSSDDGGTSGGSGDTQATAAANDTAAKDTSSSDDEKDEEPKDTGTTKTTPPKSSSEIWLDAFSFNCTGNWTDRDGALGLAPYSGSGKCTQAFPGAPGVYKLVLNAVMEFDGKSPYRVSINGQTIKEGEYPLSSSLGCDCPQEEWRSVCPDRTTNIDLGTHTLNTGDTIEFWGDDVYPCGGHGAYAKWNGIEAILK